MMDDTPKPLESKVVHLDAGFSRHDIRLKNPVMVRVSWYGGKVEDGYGWFAHFEHPSFLEDQYFGQGNTKEEAVDDLFISVAFDIYTLSEDREILHPSAEQLLKRLEEIFERVDSQH